MRRGERLFEIIEILRRARGPISAERIGMELGVNKRTVYRDVAALIAQAVPIQGEAGVGYVLEPGFHMPPLMLTSNEIEAAILGAEWVKTRGEPELAVAAQRLITKIETIAPEKLRVSFFDPVVSVAPASQTDEAFSASEVRRAIRNRCKISLNYCDAKGSETTRIVWPILVGYRDHGRIIAAWCELRQGFRYFRTERISRGTVLDEKVPRRRDLLIAEWRKEMEVERARFFENEKEATSDP